jgi:hypothetical protein
MTAPIPRRRRPRLSFLERRWLLSGKPGAIPYLEGGEWARSLWSEYGEAVTLRHIAKHPGTRPANWWRYDAPEPRDSLAETQLAYLQRLDLLSAEEEARVHVRPRLARPTAPASPLSDNKTTPPSGWELVLVNDRVELVRVPHAGAQR